MPFDTVKAGKLLSVLPQYPPIIKGWNRLEGRPRTVDFERALRAEVRDALWFLTRQWQFGEFAGEDAGSPVEARTSLRAVPIQYYAVRDGGAVPYDKQIPLETRVEHEPVPRDLTFHVQVTRYFFAQLAAHPSLATIRSLYLNEYKFSVATAAGAPDADSDDIGPLAAQHALDGGKLLDAIADGTHAAWINGVAAPLSAADRGDLVAAGKSLVEWFHRLYSQPADAAEDAWAPRFLEYQFACAAEAQGNAQTVLTADAYASGHLDWYAFDIDTRAERELHPAGPPPVLPVVDDQPLSFLPAPVSFGGMPNARYWEMENRRTEFADIDANTTDVAKLLLTEFALVYSNDWCVIPYEVEVGTVCEIAGLLVTDDFGEQVLVPAAGRGLDDNWQRWSMFTMNTNRAGGQADARLFVPPTVTKGMEGPPIEKVHFLRDEMANMAWAIERTVPSKLGDGASGYEVTRTEPLPPPASTAARYVLGTDVPGNWIPFIPVHVDGSNRSIQLRRARMPRGTVMNGRILQPGKPGSAYFLNEEEVPRAGKIVTRSCQRTRWLDGRTFVWIGRRALTGKGEGSSGLAFDQVVERTK